MKKENGQQDESFKQQQRLIENELQQALQFETKKKIALEAMEDAVQTIKQIVSTTDSQSLQQASQRLEEVIKQLNYMQGLSGAQFETVEQQKKSGIHPLQTMGIKFFTL